MGVVMASRFYPLAFVLASGIWGLGIALPDAIAQAQTAQDRKAEVEELTRQFLNHFSRGEVKESLVAQEKILSLHRMSGNLDGEFGALINIGLTYKNLGQSSKSLDYFQQALIVEKLTASKGTSTLVVISSFYSEIGQYAKALEFNQQVLERIREVGDRAGEIGTLVSIGNDYLNLGKYPNALDSCSTNCKTLY
jgi:tetratricopeptide (TPR) repeat protein